VCPPPGGTDSALLPLLRAGDEAAFAQLVDTLHGPLLAFARTFTRSPTLAEDIVQETWMAVIKGLAAFEGRSSLRTWVFGILVHRARTLTMREARREWTPGNATDTAGGADADPEWEPGAGRRGLWDHAPQPWDGLDPADLYQAEEALGVVRTALEGLPETQRQCILLRDVEGLSSEETCNILGLGETNLRVLLHRGRARIRRALDAYVRDGSRPQSVAAPARSLRVGQENEK
jgi:RNA polymerase sigma-70 factor (ECF subfamily)